MILVELGQTVLDCSILLADRQFQIFLGKYSPLKAKEGFYGQIHRIYTIHPLCLVGVGVGFGA